MSERIQARVYEAGNGFPEVGDYLTGRDGMPYQLVSIAGRVSTNGAGVGNSIEVEVELADWDDFEGEPYEAQLRLSAGEG